MIALLFVVLPAAAAPGPGPHGPEVKAHATTKPHETAKAQATVKAAPVRTLAPTRVPTAAPARTPVARVRTTPTPHAALPTAVRVVATATPQVDDPPAEDVSAPAPAEPEPEPTTPPTAVRFPTARRVAETASSPVEPTVEPTFETTIVDVAADPNARSVRTPLATPTPRATLAPTSVATPEVAGVQSSSLVDTVLMQTFEPMVDGGRIGLLGGGVSLLAALGMKLLRRRK